MSNTLYKNSFFMESMEKLNIFPTSQKVIEEFIKPLFQVKYKQFVQVDNLASHYFIVNCRSRMLLGQKYLLKTQVKLVISLQNEQSTCFLVPHSYVMIRIFSTVHVMHSTPTIFVEMVGIKFILERIQRVKSQIEQKGWFIWPTIKIILLNF